MKRRNASAHKPFFSKMSQLIVESGVSELFGNYQKFTIADWCLSTAPAPLKDALK